MLCTLFGDVYRDAESGRHRAYGILVQSEHSSGDRIQSQKEYIDEVCRGYSFASDCQLIIKTAQAMAKKYHVTFLYRDFRPYFKEGQEKARAMGLYMQKYCGCVFSEEDRFLDRKKGLVTIQKYNNRKEEDAGHKTGGGKDDGDQDSRKEKSL